MQISEWNTEKSNLLSRIDLLHSNVQELADERDDLIEQSLQKVDNNSEAIQCEIV
jgi:hypothetical protein